MRQKNTRALVETAFLTAITIVLALIGTNVPMLGMFASILVPATITIIAIKWGARYSVSAVLVEFFILATVIGPMLALIEAATFSSVGIVLGYGYRRGWGTAKLLIIPAVFFTGMMALLFAAGMALFNINLVDSFLNAYESTKPMLDNLVEQGLYTSEQVVVAETSVAAMLDVLRRTLIMMAFITGVVVTFCSAKLATLLLKRTGFDVPQLAPCSEWRVPVWTVYILLLGLVLQYWSTFRPMEILFFLGPNLYLLGACCCFIQGIGCIWYIFESYGLSVKVRTILTFVIFLLFSTYLVFLGVFDIFFDLRKRMDKRG